MLKTNPVVSRAFVRRRREVVAGTFVGRRTDVGASEEEEERWSVGRW
jgi:hypothetical protein